MSHFNIDNDYHYLHKRIIAIRFANVKVCPPLLICPSLT